MTRIYTRTGDKGETGLMGGDRVSKDSLRIEACGNVDELNSVLGLAKAFLKDGELNSLMQELQEDLFKVSEDLACPHENQEMPRIGTDRIVALEKLIDKYQVELPSLTAFVLPGGRQAGSMLHFARTVARRAERSMVTLSKAEKINDRLIPYINRLSDLLFVVARLANHRENESEVKWHASL